MYVFFLGTGEAFSEKANTSVVVNGKILLDCGLTSVQQLCRAKAEQADIELVYISHLHADHVFGLPSLLVYFKEEKREKPLLLVGPPEMEEYLKDLLWRAYRKKPEDLGFELEFKEAKGKISFQDYSLSFADMQHSVPCKAVALQRGNKKLTYTVDGRPTTAAEKLAENSDLLIAEAYMEGVEGHGSLTGSAELAKKAKAKKLAVVHISRKEKRIAAFDAALKIFPETLAVSDGDELVL